MAGEQWHINYNFIDSRGKDLGCLNNGFVSAWQVSQHLGTDITSSIDGFGVRTNLASQN